MSKLLKVVLVITMALVLTSGLVMAGCSPSQPPQPTDGGNLSNYQLEINLLGEKNEFFVDSQGRLKSKAEISSADGGISFSIDKDTMILDKDGEPLQSIYATVDPSPPLPPEDAYIVGSIYNLGPPGATFNPWLGLTLRYNPEELPEGVSENDLYVAYHNGTEWHILRHKKVDTSAHSVTTQVYHFTSFAILGPTEPPPPSTPAQGTRVGNLAPDFRLQSLDGQATSLSDLQGKPVLINFWATWCRPCVSEVPYIQEVYEEWSGKGLVVLAINIGESPSKVKEFLQSYNLSFPVLLDTKQDVAQKYNIRGIPTTFFIDKDGIIQDLRIGAFSSKAEIERSLSKLAITE